MLDDLGLAATIEWLASDFASRTGIHVELDLPADELAVTKDVSTALFRVLQESLTNVARHAQASRVSIRLSCSSSEVRMAVSDDGKGMQAGANGKGLRFGLIGMRERAAMLGGEVRIESSPGAGTSVFMIVPLQVVAPSQPLPGYYGADSDLR